MVSLREVRYRVFRHAEGDKIDLRLIDADATHAGHQAFKFIGTDSFAHYHSQHPDVLGMLRFDPVSHRLQGNVDGSFSTAELEVALPGVAKFFAGDLILA